MTEIENTVAHQQGEIKVYCAGGAGIGIGKYFEAERTARNPGYATLTPIYMDTSKASNFGVPDEFFYHLEEKDGSGGVRAENGADIIKRTKEILQKFPAGEMNIVISSTTGGSGSVMGPSIVSELLDQGKPVIAFHVGGDDTLQYIKNTIATMASYSSIAKLRETPVVLQYLHNGIDGDIAAVDLKIHVAISCLAALYSRQNKNLDGRDLGNWLNFSRPGVTSYSPQVAVLVTGQKDLDIGDANLISVVTLNDGLDGTRVNHPVEYQRVGVPMNLGKAKGDLKFPLHFGVTDGFVDTVVKKLRKAEAEYESRAAARVIRNKLTTGKEEVQSNGLVF